MCEKNCQQKSMIHMTNKIQINFRPFIYEKNIETICEYHKDHIKINFPGTKFKKDIFKSQVEKEYTEEPEGMFIIEDKEKTKDIGFLWLNTKEDIYKEQLFGDVHYIHLIKEYRGIGIGKNIMEKIDDYFKEKHVNELRIGTNYNNKAALQLYENNGYTPERIMFIKNLKE